MRSPESIYSAPATADYTATLYRFATLAAAGTFTLTGVSAQADGIMSNSPNIGAQARIEWAGVHKIEAGAGGLQVGDKVYSDATGKGVRAVATAGAYYMGRCCVAAAAGEVAQMIWSPGANAG